MPKPKSYDNIIVYGKIYTAKVDAAKDKLAGNDRYVIANAMVIKDGKFVYVGTKAEAKKYKLGNQPRRERHHHSGHHRGMDKQLRRG